MFAEMTLGRMKGSVPNLTSMGFPCSSGSGRAVKTRWASRGMSDGTCDQLYLAIRVASLEVWLNHHEPIPFIVDDVLLNFDDDRATAAVKGWPRLSGRTQVIFFTHHRRLVDLATEHLGSDGVVVIS